MARQNNRDILVARNEVEIARNDNSLGNAGYLPAVGVSAQQNRRPGGGFGTPEGGGRVGG
ncbi:MAG: TolC family protein, partial [Gemmatimonadota bacterium]|nr:TolC family protein [Gemmatimonadota bacterium]